MTEKTFVHLLAIVFIIFTHTYTATQADDGEYLYMVPYVPSDQYRVEQMLRAADTTENDIVYDLGCGDGRIVIAAAKTFGATGVGIEINAGLIAKSRANAEKAGVTDKVRFIRRDLFEVDISEATVVTLYLTDLVNRKLRPKLLTELVPGTRIVSSNFDMGEWKPDPPDIPDYDPRHKIFLWIIPANVSGIWELSISGEPATALILSQKYQEVEGFLVQDGRQLPLSEVSIDGGTLRFTLQEDSGSTSATGSFEGTADGDTIEGTIAGSGDGQETVTWRARRKIGTASQIYDTEIVF